MRSCDPFLSDGHSDATATSWCGLHSRATLLGMAGLVIDAGFLMAHHRHVQNAADAAATAAAMHLLRGQTLADATITAETFVHTHNALPAAAVEINFPPSQGPYATGGIGTYVEAIVTDSRNTFLIHVLPGVNRAKTVQARAVAGFEAVTAGEGVMVLDPTAIPGLNVSGQGVIRVNGRVVVNSEGGGIDEYGVPVETGNNGVAASAGQPNSDNGIFAVTIDVVGGVDNPELFYGYNEGDPSPLACHQPPEPDPLLYLPVPTTASGVDPTRRGDVSMTNNNVTGLETDVSGQNFQAVGGEVLGDGHVALPEEVILHPGIYDKIAIEGGVVHFIPGIYVLASQKQNQDVLKITGGEARFDGPMFYVTGDNYDPVSGWPDTTDFDDSPPAPDRALLGRVTINAEMHFSPINTDTYNYSSYYQWGTRHPGDL